MTIDHRTFTGASIAKALAIPVMLAYRVTAAIRMKKGT
jgi:hypothetical protein